MLFAVEVCGCGCLTVALLLVSHEACFLICHDSFALGSLVMAAGVVSSPVEEGLATDNHAPDTH